MAAPPNKEINELVDRLDFRTFEDFVVDVLEASMPGYRLYREVAMGPIRLDVLAVPIVEGPTPSIAFEIKKTHVTSGDLIRSQADRRESLQRRNPSFDFVLITTGGLTYRAKELIAEHNLTVWDVDDLAHRLNDEVRAK